jgi:outer membrane protein
MQPTILTGVGGWMKRLLTAVAVLLPAWNAASAQENRDIRVRVGLGGQVRPQFLGASDLRPGPLWDIDIARGTNNFRFEAPDDAFGYAVISKGSFSAGPEARLQSRRKDADFGAPLDRVPPTLEAGAFAQYQVDERLRVRADVRKGLGGHNGVIGSIGADRIWRDGDRYVFSIGPRLIFSDRRYQQAYFGVSPRAAIASAMPAYHPRGGLQAVAVASGLSCQFNSRFGVFGYARYERLVGDAARSPIVRDYGSPDQLSAGIGLNYTFTIHR